MNSKNIVFIAAAALLMGMVFVVPPASANASSNPASSKYGIYTYQTDNSSTLVNGLPAAPPPPPPAPSTINLTTILPATITPAAILQNPYNVTLPSGSNATSTQTTPYYPPPPPPPSDNTTPPPPPGPRPGPGPWPPHPRHPGPNWPDNGYYPGYTPGVTWPNTYYSWSGNYPWVGTYSYPAVRVYQEPQQVYYAPVISSFTADPSYIQPGQLATLSWSVSNGDLISISPSVGSVASTGSFAVIPTYTTTYTLTATNNQGMVSASTTVTVAPYVASYSSYDTYGTGSSTLPNAGGTVIAAADTTVNTNGVSSINTTAVNPWTMYALLIGLLAIAAAVIITLLVRRPAMARAGSYSHTGSSHLTSASATAPAATLAATSSPVTTPVEAGLPAKFVSTGGTTMPVTGQPLGRKDFQALVSPEKSDLISRKHLLVTYENSQYQIEDLNSTNGTRLNGSEIRGTGKHTLVNGDTVELAGALNLTFKT